MRIPKEKRERALGEHLGLKGERCQSPKCAMVRKPYRPGVHGPQGRPRALSDFGRQMKEKQKFKVVYGLDERNLRKLFDAAKRQVGSTASKLIELLERRLDNVVFRMRLAPSRAVARQLVVHGHIRVNGRRVVSPGYLVRAGDTVGIRHESATKAVFKNVREALKNYEVPSWLQVSPETLEGRVVAVPAGADAPFEINLLVESFSK